MRQIENTRRGINRVGGRTGYRRAALLAAAAIGLSSTAFGQVKLYFDTNGAASGFNTGSTVFTGTWDTSTTDDWTTDTTGASAPVTWLQPGQTAGSSDFNIAVFDGTHALTANVTGTVDVSGITFTTEATNIINGSGTLNFGSNNVTIANNASGTGQNIVVPITGSGTMTVTYNGTGGQGQDMNIVGDLTGFTGTLVVAPDTQGKVSGTTYNYTQLAIGSDLGAGATIQLNNFAQLTTENATGNSITGKNQLPQFTLNAPITLNPANVANSVEWIGSAGGGNYNGGGITYPSTAMQNIMTLNGVISGTSSSLFFGYGGNGGRGTVVLNNNETYTGNTYIDLAGNNGLVQLGVDNALPSGTVLSFGSNTAIASASTSSVSPLDLNGHVMTIAGLATTSTYTNSAASSTTAAEASPIGNIYNTSGNGASIVIAGTTNTTYKGDIGDANIAVNPFNDEYPYNQGTTANTNISLTINGPGVLTLAPQVEAPTSTVINYMSDEYSGNTTVNGGGLTFGRANVYGGPGYAPSTYYTLSNGNGTVTVNNGATLSSLPTTFNGGNSTFVGGSAGNIVLNSGSLFTPGGAGTPGVFITNALTFNSGAAMTFDLVNSNTSDTVFIESLTLDSSGPNHTININVPNGDTVSPGTYTLIYTNGITWDGTNGFALGTTPNVPGDKFELLPLSETGSSLVLQVLAPVLQWDPSGQGANNAASGSTPFVAEGGGTWNEGSTFFSLLDNSEVNWANNNPAYSNYDVQFGNDVTQQGSTVQLGENIVVPGLLRFGPIAQGANYIIANNGNSLTLTRGISVTTGGADTKDGSGNVLTPSAEIDAPIVLAQSQTWEVDAGEALWVNSTITENDGTPSYTVTITGTPGTTNGGITQFGGTGSSFETLNATAGTVLLTNMNALGTASVTLNGAALEFASTGTFANTFNAGGSSGFAIGANPTITATISSNITSSGSMELVDNGVLIFNGNIAAASLTNDTLGTTTFNGSATFTGNITNLLTGGRVYFNGNTTANSITISGGTTLLAAGATDNFANGININANTLVVGSASDVGVTATNTTGNNITFNPTTSNGGTLNLGGVTSLPNNISLGGTTAEQYGSTITTWPFSGPAVSVPITLSGVISGDGNVTILGTDYTLSGANTFGPPGGYGTGGGQFTLGNTGGNAGVAQTIHATNATSFGNGAIDINASGVTLDIQTTVNANSIRGNNVVTKTGTGTLILSGFTGTGAQNGLGFVIQNGAIQLNSINGLGGSSSASIATATSVSQGTITIDSGASLIANTSGNDYAGTITLAGGSITRLANAANTSDYTLTTYYTDASSSPAADTHNAVMNVTASSLIDNQDEGTYSATHADSHNLSIQMPVNVSAGATLSLEADNTAGNYEQAATVLNGISNNSTYQYNNLVLNAGSKVVVTGNGDVDLGSPTAGDPIIAMGTPGSDVSMQLGAHTFLTDSGAATQNQGTTDMTRLVVDGSGSAGLRIEAPMNATYTTPIAGGAPSLRTYDGTTGLFGINTTGTASAGTTPAGYTTIGNGFTVLSPNRAAALSNTYTLSNGTVIAPGGTLTLAATDASGATGTITTGPTSPSAVSLALANGAGSGGTLTYVINPASPDGGNFANFAGLTVEQSSAVSSASVVAQLQLNQGTTRVSSLTITGGAKVDLTNQALVIDPATGPAPTSQIAAYLTSAYDNGAWDLGGIGSSSVANNKGTSIGYVENDALANPYTNFVGQPVDNNAVIVAYTWLGDLNLDGSVDSTDEALMGKIPTTGPLAGQIGWFDGDLNYDGKINADDWALFQLGDAEQKTNTLNWSVPEPGVAAMLALGAASLGIRRRR
ncbi:MAG TPA: dockerin type I domain-containing protein [Tepidisphaeraceae bacterium]|jgi:hypothetical protein